MTAALIPDNEGETIPLIAMDGDIDEDDQEHYPIIESDELPIDREGFNIVAGKMMPVDIDDDLNIIRGNLRNMIDQGKLDIDSLSKLARDMQHPRVFDVLCNMMRTMKDLNAQLLSLNEKKHQIIQELDPAKGSDAKQIIRENGAKIDKAVFVGSTSDLQKFFKDKMSGDALATA